MVLPSHTKAEDTSGRHTECLDGEVRHRATVAPHAVLTFVLEDGAEGVRAASGGVSWSAGQGTVGRLPDVFPALGHDAIVVSEGKAIYDVGISAEQR